MTESLNLVKGMEHQIYFNIDFVSIESAKEIFCKMKEYVAMVCRVVKDSTNEAIVEMNSIVVRMMLLLG